MPLQLGPNGGLLICKVYWDVSPNSVDFTQKSVNMGPIMTPPKKNPETWGGG